MAAAKVADWDTPKRVSGACRGADRRRHGALVRELERVDRDHAAEGEDGHDGGDGQSYTTIRV